MIKTLKSELKLRPTYDEMIGMIEAQGDESRPSIETVIDRRASLFRNNQFGSQFDKVDFLGLKKQEEDRAKEEARNAQLNYEKIKDGKSTASSIGFRTPLEAFEAGIYDDYNISSEEARIRSEVERYNQMQREAREATATATSKVLGEVSSQSIPAGVPIHSMASPSLEPTQEDDDDEMLPLEPLEQEKTEEEEDLSTLQKSVVFINDFDPDKIMENRNIDYKDLLFQLYVRDKLTDTMIDTIRTRPDDEAKKRHAVALMEGLKQNDEWSVFFTREELKRKSNEFKKIKKRLNETSSSSSGIVDTLVSGAKSVGSAVVGAGKEIVKDAVVEGAKTAVMSLL